MNILAVMSRLFIFLVSSLFSSDFTNIRQFFFAEMEAIRQRVRATAARKKEEKKNAKRKDGTSSSVL